MKITNICNRNAVVADENSDVLMAAQLMRQHHVSTIIIVSNKVSGKKPIGIISDQDLVFKVLAENRSVNDITLHDVMTMDMVCIRDDYEIIDTIHLMCLEGIRSAPVIDENGNLVGVLTMDNLFEILADEISNYVKIIGMGQQQGKRLECSQETASS